MKKETKDILNKFVEAKLQLEAYQKVVDDMKADVIEILKESPEQKTETDNALFSLRKMTTYSYSKDVLAKEKAIKAVTKAETDILKFMKQEEVETGVAKIKSETLIPVVKLS